MKSAKVSANNVQQALAQQSSYIATVYEPLPENIVIVQTQGQRDQQAMHELHILLTSPGQSLEVKAAKLIPLLPMLTQHTVSSYISHQKDHYPLLREIISMIQNNIDMLDVGKLAALTFAATIVGGAPWSHLPTMLRNLENGLRSQVLHQLQALLA